MYLNVPEEKFTQIGMEFESEADTYNFYNEYIKWKSLIGYFVVNVKGTYQMTKEMNLLSLID
ncbi:hypothetical protein ACS0TY_032839 [Phlomoides rotata]